MSTKTELLLTEKMGIDNRIIDLINEALSAKKNWIKQLNLSVEGEPMRQRVIQYISQVKNESDLVKLKNKAETALKSYP